MINKVIVEGFRGITFGEARFEDLNVLIGASGSGKSALLGALDLARRAAEGDSSLVSLFNMDIADGSHMRHMDFAGDDPIRIRLEGDGGRAFDVDLYGYGNLNSRIAIRCQGSGGELGFETDVSRWIGGHARSRLADALGVCGDEFTAAIKGLRVYSFSDATPLGAWAPLRHTAALHDNRYLRPDGKNLAAWLYLLRAKDGGEYKWIEKRIKGRFPFIREIVLEPDEGEFIRLRWRDERSGRILDGAFLPGGAGAYIALCALLGAPAYRAPAVTLIDAVEAGLDARQLIEIAELAERTADDRRVVLATRSSRMIDLFEARDVLLAYRIGGGCKFARLDPVRVAPYLERDSLGGLWERNMLGGFGGSAFEEKMASDKAAAMHDGLRMTHGYI